MCESETILSREFIATPPVLIVHLLRFKLNPKMHSIKDETCVLFPLDNLTIGKAKYKLYATIEHAGTIQFGHFTANCLVGDKWFHFNDDRVTEISQKAIVSKNVYILFYHLISS